MDRENLYFIAIVPSKEICDEITAFKLDLAQRFESKTALKVIPHITLKAPFKLAASRHLDLKQWFQQLSVNSGAFQIELRNFGAFHNENHPVIYVQPIIDFSLLSLQNEIVSSFRFSYPEVSIMDVELKFAPHITIAYRDLSFEKFLEAWKIYRTKEYEAVFDVSSFFLFQHNGKNWDVIDTYFLA